MPVLQVAINITRGETIKKEHDIPMAYGTPSMLTMAC